MVKTGGYYFRVLKRRFNALGYNMHLDADEIFFKKIYSHYINPFLIQKEKILEIGCQYGRFTIDMINNGKSVTATDIDSKYGDYIKKQVGSKPFVFKNESIIKTLSGTANQYFDLILCLEVMHFVPGALDKLLENGKKFLSPDGLLIFTIRPKGFYVEKLLSFKSYKEIDSILQGHWNDYECFTSKEIIEKLQHYNWKVEKLASIGVFAKKKEDCAYPVVVPSKLEQDEKDILFHLETKPENQIAGLDRARYLLVIASPL